VSFVTLGIRSFLSATAHTFSEIAVSLLHSTTNRSCDREDNIVLHSLADHALVSAATTSMMLNRIMKTLFVDQQCALREEHPDINDTPAAIECLKYPQG
jgi:hypothetical protein